MKRICLILIGLLIATFSINLNAKNEKSKKEERIEKAKKRLAKDKYLNSMYTIEDEEELKIQKILEFPGYSKEQLTEFVRNYLSNRIERQTQGADDFTASSKIFINDGFVVSESSPNLGSGIFVLYTFKFEIKHERLRATMLINSYVSGGKHHITTSYPYRSIGKGLLKKFATYAEMTLNDIQTNLVKIHEDRINDDW